MTPDQVVLSGVAIIVGGWVLKQVSNLGSAWLKRRLLEEPQAREEAGEAKRIEEAARLGRDLTEMKDGLKSLQTSVAGVATKADLAELDTKVQLLGNELRTQTATVAEVRSRVEGVSTNHGGRLGRVEEAAIRLDERVKVLEERRKR